MFNFRTCSLIINSVLCLIVVASLMAQPVYAADILPPTTNLVLSGIKGSSDWYITNVDVNLRAFDLESSPASTTYRVNSDAPVTTNYQTLDNAIVNPSFEDGWGVGINNWQSYPVGNTHLYQSSISKLDYRSAAIESSGNSYHYWTNYENYVQTVAGRSYTVSAWMRAFNVQTAPGAWFEVWALDSTSVNSDLKLNESERVTGEMEWSLKSVSVTVPSGYDGIYLKMGAQSGDNGIAWYDGVSMHTGSDAVTQFTMVQNGQNSLSYYSTDNQGNVEAQQVQTPIKIDTAEPQDWSNFRWQEAGNDHTYVTWVDVRDIASGIVPSSAQYRWYDDANCNCWSSWLPVQSVTRLDNGAAAPLGYTGYVTIMAPATDMGNSSIHTKPEVQFRIQDVASSNALSPTYSLFGPWLQVQGSGDIYARGGIGGLGPIPASEFTTSGIIAGGAALNNVSSFYSWLVSPYQHNSPSVAALIDLIPQYDQIRISTKPLPGNKLPSTSGTYIYTGNYTIDQNSITSAFTSSVYSAIVVIEGNLNINRDFSLHENTAVAFLVTGSVTYSKEVNHTEGVIIAAGNINTNGSIDDDNKDGSLNHEGSLIAGNNLIFGRDLGKNKNPDDPAEIISFPVKYYANSVFVGLFNPAGSSLTWQEAKL